MSGMTSTGTAGRARGLDLARGLAVLAMVAYHFAWDLSHFGLIETDVGLDAGWKRFAQAIAASFLAIAGASLALSAQNGLDRRAFLKRLAKIIAAALAITAATYIAFPDRFIFFGILHCIAVSSVLALPFLKRHWGLSALAGLFVLALPLVYRSPFFEHPALVWLGLGTEPPLTNDFAPVFPWTGCLLLGLAAGKLWLARGGVAAATPPSLLARIGRWSLPIYLVHQPLMFAAFLALGHGGLVTLAPEVKPFVQSCAVDCETSGSPYPVCSRACACVARTLRDRPVWQRVVADAISREDQDELSLVGQRCFQASAPPDTLTKPEKAGP